MKLHGNARTCPHGRSLIVRRVEEEGWSLTQAAAAACVSERTAAKWLARWRAEGERGLADRSSAPRRIPAEGRVEFRFRRAKFRFPRRVEKARHAGRAEVREESTGEYHCRA